MTRYVALVRGINVGGKARVPMPILRGIFSEHYVDGEAVVLEAVCSRTNGPQRQHRSENTRSALGQ